MHPWTVPVLERLAKRLDTLPHALLIHGVPGVGKLALAEEFSKLLLCEGTASSPRPCGRCDACRWFAAGNHPDVRMVEPSALSIQAVQSTGECPLRSYREEFARRALEEKEKRKPSHDIRVEQVRELADFLYIGSHRGARRIALVHPAEDMNPSAANALLKSLEEPPAGAIFVLVTHRPAGLPPTIRSRCVGVPVAIPERPVALSWLKEQGAQSPEKWLAYAGGAPLRALQYAEGAGVLDGLLGAIGRGAILADDRDTLEALAEALQKVALDRALAALGLPPKYGTKPAGRASGSAKAWLDYARAMGSKRMLARHPLNPRLLGAEMQALMPSDEKH